MSEKHYVVSLHKGFDKEEIINDLNRDTTLDSNVAYKLFYVYLT